jgi:hypothetical protein
VGRVVVACIHFTMTLDPLGDLSRRRGEKTVGPPVDDFRSVAEGDSTRP